MKWTLPILFALCATGAAGQSRAWPPPDSAVGDTLFVDCAKARAHHIVSPLSFSENGLWRAYVDVDEGSPECLLRSALWIARGDGAYQLAYFIAPERGTGGDGIQILGWMPGSSIVLVRMEQWQWGSDAIDIQRVLAIEASKGLVYEPRLSDISEAHRGKQCRLRLEDAGFANPKSLEILVRVKLVTAYDADESIDDVPPVKRCNGLEETWNFNYSSAYEVTQVSNRQRLLLFRSTGSFIESPGLSSAGGPH
jgi:hypothetical protein